VITANIPRISNRQGRANLKRSLRNVSIGGLPSIFRGRCDREVHLPFEDIDASNKHRQVVANLKPLA
jgi:hypothetical protein